MRLPRSCTSGRGAVGVIEYMVKQGVSVSLGHMNPEVEEIQATLAAGATAFTHVLNAATRENISAKGLRKVTQFTGSAGVLYKSAAAG